MEVSKILAEYDAMLAAGRRREAGEFLSEAADVAAREDDAVSEASLRGELTGYWRVFGEPEKSFASAERQTDEALALNPRVEEIYEHKIATDDDRFASLDKNMAQAVMRAGRAAEAYGYFERSLARLSPADDAAEIATCRTNMAFCLLAQRKPDEAGECLKLAEEIYASLPDDPHAASALSCRGQLEYMRGEFSRAAEYFAKSAASVERFFGRTANYAAACRSCAKSFEAAGEPDEAAKYRALADSAGGAARGAR